ncbi:MAG TPA: hypothetical protein VFT74_04165 [Isosphaeraceae bacterium]|nr:hypothetical protein [Isosphaeraceae bacterium]
MQGFRNRPQFDYSGLSASDRQRDVIRMFEQNEPAESPAEQPRFCPSCRKRARTDSALCAECGDRLIEQGYCSICDREWVLPIGALCPKHDIPLESHQTRAPDEFPLDHETTWVEVARFAQPSTAIAPRLRLDSEGIPTFLDGERVALESAYNLASGGVKLLVPASLAHDARVILDQTWAPVSPSADDPEDLDDAWDSLEPYPAERRRTVMKLIIVAILALPLLDVLFQILFA